MNNKMEEEYYNEKIDNAQSSTPEELARQLFNNEPGEPCSKGILPVSKSYDTDAASLVFEILITIYLEGLMNIMAIQKSMYENELGEEYKNKKDYDKDYEIYKNVTINDLKFPEPWFNSFGYRIFIEEYDKKNRGKYNQKIKPFSYCRIILSFDPKDRLQFIFKKIENRYHFILNANYKPTNELTKIYAVLSKGDKFYKISFKRLLNKEELLH